MDKKFKLGLDIHGVIDTEPELFSKITSRLSELGCEIHILTGSHITENLKEELRGYNMKWDGLFSISDHHREVGTKMWYDDSGNPWVDDLDWDMTKSEYCEKNEITIHLDDTRRYGKYFKTNFLHLDLRYADKIVVPEISEIKTNEDLIKWVMSMFSSYEKYAN